MDDVGEQALGRPPVAVVRRLGGERGQAGPGLPDRALEVAVVGLECGRAGHGPVAGLDQLGLAVPQPFDLGAEAVDLGPEGPQVAELVLGLAGSRLEALPLGAVPAALGVVLLLLELPLGLVLILGLDEMERVRLPGAELAPAIARTRSGARARGPPPRS